MKLLSIPEESGELILSELESDGAVLDAGDDASDDGLLLESE